MQPQKRGKKERKLAIAEQCDQSVGRLHKHFAFLVAASLPPLKVGLWVHSRNLLFAMIVGLQLRNRNPQRRLTPSRFSLCL